VFGATSMATARSSPIRPSALFVDGPNRAEVSRRPRRHVLDLPAAGIGVPVGRTPQRRASLAVAAFGLPPPLAATRRVLGRPAPEQAL
jgi:hypothetical protein